MNKCVQCHAVLLAKRQDARYCSKACQEAAQPPCSRDDCSRPRRARGLCGSHYNAAFRSRPAALSLPCAVCQEPTAKTADARRAFRFCSKACLATAYGGRERGTWSCQVPDAHPSRSTVIPADHPCRTLAPSPAPYPERGPACVVFIRDCMICNRVFTTPYTVPTCSDSCAALKKRAIKSEHRHRRRARERGAFVAPVNRKEIYERDGWRCHICRKKVRKNAVVPHPLAPTIDHVIPLVPLPGQEAGTHEPANARTAHFLCNALKGNRGGNEQLLLIG